MREVGSHRRHREGRRVRRQDGLGRDDPLELSKHTLLEAEHLGHGLDDEVTRGEVADLGRAGHGAEDRRSGVARHPLRRDELVHRGAHEVEPLAHTLLVEVTHDHGDAEPLREQQRELSSHEARPDDAHARHRSGRPRVGGTRRALALVHCFEGIDARPELVGEQERRQRVLLCGEPRVEVVVPDSSQDVERPVRRRTSTVDHRVQALARDRQRAVPHLLRLTLRTGHAHLAAHHRGSPDDRLLEEVGRVEERVGDPDRERLSSLVRLVRRRTSDDDLERLLQPHDPWEVVAPAPPRDETESRLRQPDRGNVARDRPVRTAQRDLQPTTERDTVDEPERRDAHLGEQAVRIVPRRCEVLRSIGAGQLLRARQIGAGHEEVRLPGDSGRDDLSCRGTARHLRERERELSEPLLTEGRRFGVVEPVVERDERERARASREGDVPDVRMGHALRARGRGGRVLLSCRRVRHVLPLSSRSSWTRAWSCARSSPRGAGSPRRRCRPCRARRTWS